jgi:hypothetical protein
MSMELIHIFYKCRTSLTKVEFLKTATTGARTFVLRLTIHCFTTAPHLPYNSEYQAKRVVMKKEGLYSLHSTQLVCEFHSYPIFLVWDACTVQCMYLLFLCFSFLIAVIVPIWKLNYRQIFLIQNDKRYTIMWEYAWVCWYIKHLSF